MNNVEETVHNSKIKCLNEAQSRTFSQKSQGIRLKNRVKDLEKKLDNMDLIVNESEFVKKDLKQLKILEQYSKSLVESYQKIDEKIKTHQIEIINQKNSILTK